MKKIFLGLCLILLQPALALAANGYWDNMSWDSDTWYFPAGHIELQLATSVTGQPTSLLGATVTLTQNGQTATPHGNGTYTFTDVPLGTYSVQIEKSNFNSEVLGNIEVSEGQTTSPPIQEMIFSCESGLEGDINGQGQIGLEEAINALKVVSGINSD